MNYDPNTHHRRSIRLQDYDYSQAGAYFITICALDRKMFLGDVRNETVALSSFGQIVHDWWYRLTIRFQFVELDAFTIMPNHFHGIIVLHDRESATPRTGAVPAPQSTNDARANPRRGLVSKPLPNPNVQTLGQIIAYFKYLTTRDINVVTHTPGERIWQRNYYEHVIRDEKDLAEKREYIINNPLKWELDRYYVR
ncbi:MAG: transposase [candidate division Zixibacteria bacterium]|nr:transposase [candidate division Zixibacteria bacterium]